MSVDALALLQQAQAADPRVIGLSIADLDDPGTWQFQIDSDRETRAPIYAAETDTDALCVALTSECAVFAVEVQARTALRNALPVKETVAP